ncbi:MAG TPA: protein-glutamate O-methyltransferase [Candidatus Binatia bacterium]|nr:protein-glutamate O-methyltransferase [Candidatus Binatia bacterium]
MSLPSALLPAGEPGADPVLSREQFERFRQLAARWAGLALGPHKRAMLQARLVRRLRALGLATFEAYWARLTDPASGAEERVAFINALTTNKTEFFREPHHFAYLRTPWATALAAPGRPGGRRLRLWSAGCASGEEAYSLAIVLAEAGLVPSGWDTRILASDIDTEALDTAAAGIYPAERLAPLGPQGRARHFTRRAEAPDAWEVRPALRALVTFRRINLVDEAWPIRTRFDVIFCRNVLIYFDRPTQQRVLRRLVGLLVPGGLLALGHAESAFGLVDGLTLVAPTLYRVAA